MVGQLIHSLPLAPPGKLAYLHRSHLCGSITELARRLSQLAKALGVNRPYLAIAARTRKTPADDAEKQTFHPKVPFLCKR
jgi:hypothetical protein